MRKHRTSRCLRRLARWDVARRCHAPASQPGSRDPWAGWFLTIHCPQRGLADCGGAAPAYQTHRRPGHHAGLLERPIDASTLRPYAHVKKHASNIRRVMACLRRTLARAPHALSRSRQTPGLLGKDRTRPGSGPGITPGSAASGTAPFANRASQPLRRRSRSGPRAPSRRRLAPRRASQAPAATRS